MYFFQNEKIHVSKIYSVDDLQINRPNAENNLTRVESVTMSKILIIRSMNVMNAEGANEQFDVTGVALTVGVDLDDATYRRLNRAGAAVPYVDPATFVEEPQGIPGPVGERGMSGITGWPGDAGTEGEQGIKGGKGDVGIKGNVSTSLTKAQLEELAKRENIEFPEGSTKAQLIEIINAENRKRDGIE